MDLNEKLDRKFGLDIIKKEEEAKRLSEELKDNLRNANNSVVNNVEDTVTISFEAGTTLSTINVPDLDARLEELLERPGGLQNIAVLLQNPTRLDVLFRGFARRALITQPLAAGEPSIFDRDIRVNSGLISRLNDAEERDAVYNTIGNPRIPQYNFISEGDRIEIPTFEVASMRNVSYEEVHNNARMSAIFQRLQQYMVDDIRNHEDRYFFGLAETITSNYNWMMSGLLNRDTLAAAFSALRAQGYIVSKIVAHPSRAIQIRDNIVAIERGNDTALVTQYEILQSGIMGTLWNAQVFTNLNCGTNHIYVMAMPEILGIMPVRSDLTVVPFDDVRRLAMQFICFENIGMAILNANGIIRINLEA